jgi:hypothetical protein
LFNQCPGSWRAVEKSSSAGTAERRSERKSCFSVQKASCRRGQPRLCRKRKKRVVAKPERQGSVTGILDRQSDRQHLAGERDDRLAILTAGRRE